MPTKITIDPTSFFGKCHIYWKTHSYGHKIEHISLLLAVAIYMNKNIYEEELQSAQHYLTSLMKDETDVDNIMKYVKMKLGTYQEDNESWMKDRQEAFNLILKHTDYYGFMSDIFKSDGNFDESEEMFEATLKRLL